MTQDVRMIIPVGGGGFVVMPFSMNLLLSMEKANPTVRVATSVGELCDIVGEVYGREREKVD